MPTVSSFNRANDAVPAKFRKFKTGVGTFISLTPHANSKTRFVQRVLISLPRLKPPYPPPDSRNPSPLSEGPDPNSITNSSQTSASSQTSTPSPDGPKSTQPRPRRIPRSEMRALYRTLGSAELELRTRLAVDRFRDVVMEYIYATHKPNLPFPTTMQMRMHPPIARAAQDLDEVDHALKLAREAERRLANQQPVEVKKRATRQRKTNDVQPLGVVNTNDPSCPTVPVKRKRGRPRKHPLPEAVAKPTPSQSGVETTQ